MDHFDIFLKLVSFEPFEYDTSIETYGKFNLPRFSYFHSSLYK